ncbi:glycosyltransferase family 9 protein [Taibaiella chishuiensis]|uniref:ADP-heptose:LPS heptosyltransferase n=1 Tax=Taibaiella chishuiensis TaxID=1434707 RepID=A0A2P8DCD0_9BACT|nr:glycosyltransferase family 9 protein [Taibaiella chishuiensis]PSK94872.1 ADP-heptose:LPS heptosyltransferase [Taibaiella chishuiensis]
MKLLLIRFSSIGDIVLTTPVLRCIRRQYPDAEIHFLVKQSFKAVVAHNPHIDVIHTLDKDLNANIETLKKIGFDYVIDLHRNLRTMRVKRAIDAPALTFDKLNFRKWLYVNFKWNVMPDKSIVDRYFEGMRPLKLQNDGQGLDYFIAPQQETRQDDIPMGHWAGFIACVIGGSYATKKFPVSKWRELAQQSPYPMILLGGPEDRDEGNEIAAVDPGKVYNACGKFSLNESADLVRRSKVVITNDTGLMHIAAAYKKPVVSLWGNTTPEMGMFPYYGFNNLNQNVAQLSVIHEVKGLGCRPCSKIGYPSCPKKHFKCMVDIPVGPVIESVKKFWKL